MDDEEDEPVPASLGFVLILLGFILAAVAGLAVPLLFAPRHAHAAPAPSCLVLGDSIAVGTGRASGCRTVARVGIASGLFLRSWGAERVTAARIIVSLGANDGDNPATADHLRQLRASLDGRVVWLLPARPAAARLAIRTVAWEWRDGLVDTAPWATGRDHLHPSGAGYRAIALEALR